MSKATYMYWQKRSDRENPDSNIGRFFKSERLTRIMAIVEWLENWLKIKQGYCVNKKKVQCIMQKLFTGYFFHSKKSKYSSV